MLRMADEFTRQGAQAPIITHLLGLNYNTYVEMNQARRLFLDDVFGLVVYILPPCSIYFDQANNEDNEYLLRSTVSMRP